VLDKLIPTADYGMAIMVVIGVFYLIGKGLDIYYKLGTKNNPMETHNDTNPVLVVALENNTRAMCSMTELLAVMRTTQVTALTMTEELVAKARLAP
jgi:hypothetical protein